MNANYWGQVDLVRKNYWGRGDSVCDTVYKTKSVANSKLIE